MATVTAPMAPEKMACLCDTGARKSLLTAFTVRRLLSQHPDTGGPRSYGTRSDHAQPPSAARGAAPK